MKFIRIMLLLPFYTILAFLLAPIFFVVLLGTLFLFLLEKFLED